MRLTEEIAVALPIAKATTESDRSSSIVVPFHARWQDRLTDLKVSAVIRKRVPRDGAVEWVYVYITAPISAFVARAEVLRIETIRSKSQAYQLSKQLCLTHEEIDNYYIGQFPTMGLYRLGRFEVIRTPLSLASVRGRLVFHPPQSFSFLSDEGERCLREMMGLR